MDQSGGSKIDDNLPTGKNIIFENSTESVVGYRSDGEGKSVNIYSHFGRPDIWPRGFPLQEIDIRRPTSYLPEYESLPVQVRNILSPPMLIQQGLADLDPDVDAIFRLTQVQELKQAKFCKKSPSIRLSPGTFCPFNSQVQAAIRPIQSCRRSAFAMSQNSCFKFKLDCPWC